MNKYQELVNLIEKNKMTITKKACYDSQSGWTGANIIIKDDQVFEFDLSGNGYCFNDNKVDEALSAIKSYLEYKNLTTFEAFKKCIENKAISK